MISDFALYEIIGTSECGDFIFPYHVDERAILIFVEYLISLLFREIKKHL